MIPEPKYLEMYKYIVHYPNEDEEDYDGVHNGEIRGFRKGTPKRIMELYEEDRLIRKNAQVCGWGSLPTLEEMETELEPRSQISLP